MSRYVATLTRSNPHGPVDQAVEVLWSRDLDIPAGEDVLQCILEEIGELDGIEETRSWDWDLWYSLDPTTIFERRVSDTVTYELTIEREQQDPLELRKRALEERS